MSWSRLWETRLVPQLAHGVLTHHSGISLNHSCTYLNLKPVAGKWASLMAQMVKNLPATQETWVPREYVMRVGGQRSAWGVLLTSPITPLHSCSP